MPEVFKRVNGRKLTKHIAILPEVQAAVDDHAVEIAADAEAILAAHYHEGDANITVDKGKVDSYVILEDPDGGAMAIEFGRGHRRLEDGSLGGGMEAIAPLRRAAFNRRVG